MTIKTFLQLKPATSLEERRAFADASIWYDYFGVPQIKARTVGQVVAADLQAAVDSIPAYIANSTNFMILSPTCSHTDLDGAFCNRSTWNDRGWCRTEHAVWALTAERPKSLTIMSKSLVQESHPLQWLFTIPRTGSFAVENDRMTVEELMMGLVKEKLLVLHEQGKIFDWRFLKAASVHFAAGQKTEADLNSWLGKFLFKDSKDLSDVWGPIHIAALECNIPVMEALVKSGVDVNCKTPKYIARLMACRGMTPLMIAAHYITMPDANVASCAALLRLRATLENKQFLGQTALHLASATTGGPMRLWMYVA